MNLLPVFISYKQVDGTEFATWLHVSLQGRMVSVRRQALILAETISVYLDQETPAIPDWQDQHSRALEKAAALLVICTPATKWEFKDRKDWFYHEIRWWLANRSSNAPILIAPFGKDWIPEIVQDRWPNAQFIKLPPASERVGYDHQQRIIDRILRSIVLTATQNDTSPDAMSDDHGSGYLVNPPGLFMWEKDKFFRYTNCNENYARAAGFDSPGAMIGKTDDQMPWRTLADMFRAGDQQVISGTSPRQHVTEREITVDGPIDILVSENQRLDWRGECVGLTGYFEDITGWELIQRASPPDPRSNSVCLGTEFGNECLSSIEAEVLKGVLAGRSAEKIAILLKTSRLEVESHINVLKRKLQCTTTGDLITAVMRAGLPLKLFRPKKKKRL